MIGLAAFKALRVGDVVWYVARNGVQARRVAEVLPDHETVRVGNVGVWHATPLWYADEEQATWAYIRQCRNSSDRLRLQGNAALAEADRLWEAAHEAEQRLTQSPSPSVGSDVARQTASNTERAAVAAPAMVPARSLQMEGVGHG